MGYDERGWCPMLTEHGCSIVEDRPRTCRAFDCRVHAAAGTAPAALHAHELFLDGATPDDKELAGALLHDRT